MFVEHEKRIAAEPSREPQVKLKPSEAIKLGRLMIEENERFFRQCGLGCVFAAVKGRQMTEREEFDMWLKHGWLAKPQEDVNDGIARDIGQQCGLSEQVALSIHRMHFKEKLPALEIARRLEAQGY